MNTNLANMLKPIADTTVEGGFLFHNPRSPLIAALAKDGMIVGNDAERDPTNGDKIAFTATAAGLAALGLSAVVGTVATPPAAATPVTRGPNAVRPAPTIHRTGMRFQTLISSASPGRGRREETYPFSTLEAPNEDGQDSFFVLATEHLTNPTKQLASTVGSANKRFKSDGRVFKIIRVDADQEHVGVDGKGLAGARIVRVK